MNKNYNNKEGVNNHTTGHVLVDTVDGVGVRPKNIIISKKTNSTPIEITVKSVIDLSKMELFRQ